MITKLIDRFRKRRRLVIVLDLDNTLADDFGSQARPNAIKFLKHLNRHEHTLILWTNSPRERAKEILSRLKFARFFCETIFREDYDPFNTGLYKDIRQIEGDIIIDDDPEEIRKNIANGKIGYLIPPYRQSQGQDTYLLKALKDLQL